MTTFSCTPLFNELDVLEIRLATLDPVVDVHVVAEATVTHKGDPKPLHFEENIHRFKPWLPKIRYVIVNDMPGGTAAQDIWAREKHQRRALAAGLTDVQRDDLILLSDLDEIPHPDAIRQAQPPEHLRCHMHVGRLNWRWPGDPGDGYTISRIFPAGMLKEQNLEEIRLLPWSSQPERPIGWHLSYMGDIRTKLSGFAHQETTADDDQIKAQVDTGADLFGRADRQSEWTDDLPPYVLENRDRFSHLLVTQP